MLKNKEEQISKLAEIFLLGEQESFRYIASLIHQDILNIAYRYVGNLEDSKDVLQEVLLKIYYNLKSFKKESKFSSWIYRIIINASIDFLRKRRRRFNVKNRYIKNKQEETSSKDKIDEKDKETFVKEAIALLPLRQKSVFVLRHYQRLKIEEISRILGCSQSSVKTHLKRAVDNMIKRMGGIK